jgi:hypothetical protein
MNVISMMNEILRIANPMIGKSALPDFLCATDDCSEFMRVGALDQLDCAFDRYVVRRSPQQVNVFGHNDECVQFVAALSAIAVERLQKKADINFDDEQFPAMVRRERHEVSSRRGYESSRLQEQTSAAGSRMSFRSLNWHEWNSCPSRWFYFSGFRFGKTD